MVLDHDGVQIFADHGAEQTIPIKRIVSAEALDSRKGALYLRNGNYTWQGQITEPAEAWSGDLEEVTCKQVSTATKFM